MQYTENLNLLKPDKDDKYLVDHMNGNSDALDAAYLENRHYAENKSAEALQSAKSYASTQDEEVLSTANSHAEGKAADALASAKEYADGKATAAVSTANAYTDGQAEETYDMAKTYADGKASEALSDAKGYADTKSAAAVQSAKAYSDEIKKEITGDMGGAFKKKSITIPATGWEEVAHTKYFSIYIQDTDVTAETVVNINLGIGSLDVATECGLQTTVISFNGYYQLHALGVPTAEMTGTVTLQKEVE